MSNLNMNKAAAAVLCAGLIAMVAGKVTEFLYYGGPQHPGHHEEVKRGYSIEVVETAGASEGAAPAGPADIAPLLASADLAAGGDLFAKKCATCHDGTKGGPNKVGPHLWGVFNRKVASVGDFNYSAAMKTHGDKSWNVDELNHFLYKPAKHVPGTIMSFAGMPKDQDRANVVAYIKSLQ